MGAGANVNAFFGVMTMIIAIPTGVKIFNWLFTIYGGRIRFTVPLLWTLGFMVTFVIGGMTGVLLAVPPVDFVLHNSLFLVAHFHNVIIGGVLFGAFAGYDVLVPESLRLQASRTARQGGFWCWIVGFYVAFMPLYALGLMGMTRRMNHSDNPEWQPYLIVAAAGAALIMLGIVLQIVQLVVSIRQRERCATYRRPVERADARVVDCPRRPRITSPSFPRSKASTHIGLPGAAMCLRQRERSEDIEMPKRSALGSIGWFFAVAGGFGMVWHIYWRGGRFGLLERP